MSQTPSYAPLAVMADYVKEAGKFYRLGQFNKAFSETSKALNLIEHDEMLRHSLYALRLRDEALLLAYKASVADTKSTLGLQIKGLRIQRSLLLEAERALDAGSSILARIRAIDGNELLFRQRRNRADDRAHDMVPGLKVMATKKQMRRWIKRHIGI